MLRRSGANIYPLPMVGVSTFELIIFFKLFLLSPPIDLPRVSAWDSRGIGLVVAFS